MIRFYGMSYFWYTLFSIFTALVVSVVVSYFTGRIETLSYALDVSDTCFLPG